MAKTGTANLPNPFLSEQLPTKNLDSFGLFMMIKNTPEIKDAKFLGVDREGDILKLSFQKINNLDKAQEILSKQSENL